MRIWDIPPAQLCHKHLLGEHRELHALWTVITQHKKGYSQHPETKRWVGKLKALYARHDMLVNEMHSRGYSHKTPLEGPPMKDGDIQDVYINTIEEQKALLNNKNCKCTF